MKIGRWELGGLAKDHAGEVYKVIAFITSPAVILENAKTGEQQTYVIGCPLEVEQFVVYAPSPAERPQE